MEDRRCETTDPFASEEILASPVAEETTEVWRKYSATKSEAR